MAGHGHGGGGHAPKASSNHGGGGGGLKLGTAPLALCAVFATTILAILGI